MQKYKETYIRDEFEGWNGDTVYELDDGSKWELTSYTYSFLQLPSKGNNLERW